MGATEARLFCSQGAEVVFGDLLDELGAGVEAEIREQGGEATYLHLDDVLVNNAGIIRRLSIEDTSEEVWDETMAVNAKGVFLGTKYAIPAMRRAGGGSIVNISSISGLLGVGVPAYIASKGAVRLFTKTTAIQHAKDNIRCNSVHPASVDTDMRSPDDFSKIPLGRIGTTNDIAYGVLFLASDEASFITGSELVIDGGYTAQ